MKVNFFSYDQVLKLIPMRSAIEALRVAFKGYDPNLTLIPQRHLYEIGEGEFGTVMPAYSPSSGYGVKLSTIMPQNPKKYGLNLIHSVYCAFSPQTGEMISLIDGCALTNIRTGAICGLSVDLLTDQYPKSVAIIGAGTQARFFYEAVSCVRVIEEISIYSKTVSSAQKFKEDLYEAYDFCGNIRVCNSPIEAIEGRDIVGTTTSTASPNGFVKKEGLSKKAHVCAIGGRTLDACEIDPQVLKDRTVVLDNIQANLVESAELRTALKKGYLFEDKILSLQDLLNLPEVKVSELRDKSSYFRSVGTALQDMAVSTLLIQSMKN